MARHPRQFARYVLHTVGIQTLLVLALVVFGFLVTERLLVRWDLTEDARFTISEASKRIAREVQQPLKIRAYFSSNVPPRLEPFRRHTLDILEEYVAANRKNIQLERFDPTESAQAEAEAENYGVTPVEIPVYEATSVSVMKVFGAIVLLYLDKRSEVINVAARFREGYEGLSVLEYEVSSKMWQLTHDKPKLGIAGSLTSDMPRGDPFAFAGGGPKPEFESLQRVLGEAFEIDQVDLKTEDLDPAKMPCLAVVRPKELSDVEVFRLDQYLVKGGRVVLFITNGAITVNQFTGMSYRSFSTGLDEWLAHHGVRVPNEFVVHYQTAVPVGLRSVLPGTRLQVEVPTPNWFWPQIRPQYGGFDAHNPAVQSLTGVTFYWPHPVDVIADRFGPDKQAHVLVRSHAQESWRWKETSLVDFTQIDHAARQPRREDIVSSPIVVALEGKFTSYFADRPPPPSLMTPAKRESGNGGEEMKPPEVVKASEKPTHMVVVGNAVFVSDLVFGSRGNDDTVKQNAALAFNLLDWLARSEDLIALRAKRYEDRTLVDKEFKEAFERLVARQEELSELEFGRALDEAREKRNARQRRWRWINVTVPALVVIAAGFSVWILRAARRAQPARLPAPVPPKA
jgi:ABC-2 type transport system permease protein